MKKDIELRSILETELPRRPLPPRAVERVEETYRTLGIQKEPQPAKDRRRSKKSWIVAVSAVAASFILLFGTNAMFPAFAEELPLVGGLFQRMNSIGVNAPTYGQLIQPAEGQAKAGPYSLAVSEAYSDGKFLLFTLGLSSDDPEINKMALLGPAASLQEEGPGYSLTVNGEKADLEESVRFEKSLGYETICYSALPSAYQDGDKIHVELRMERLFGHTEKDLAKAWTDSPSLILETPVSLAFDVVVNTAYNRNETVGLTVDNITLDSWEVTPTIFAATVSYPCPGGLPGIFAETRTDGGELLQENELWGDSLQEPPADPEFGDTVTTAFHFAGPASSAKQITLTLYNRPADLISYDSWVDGGKMGTAVFAEFTIDLKSGKAVPSKAYLQRGYEHADISAYAAQLEAGAQYRDHVFVPGAHGIQPDLGLTADGSSLKNGAFALRFSFYSDSGDDLPLKARFLLDDMVFAEVPLCASGDPAGNGAGTAENHLLTGDTYESRYYVWPDGDTGLRKNCRRQYIVTAYILTERPKTKKAAEDHWNAHGGAVELVNTETGEIVYDSGAQTPTHYPIQEETE